MECLGSHMLGTGSQGQSGKAYADGVRLISEMDKTLSAPCQRYL